MNRVIWIILILLASCKPETKYSALEKIKNNSMYVDVQAWSNEILDIDSVIISGKIKVVSLRTEVEQKLGKPKEIVNIKSSKYFPYLFSGNLGSTSYMMIYDNLMFEGTQNYTILNRIDLTENNYLEIQGLRLKKDFDIRDLCLKFPESCKLIILKGNAWSGHIELRASKKAVYETLRWVLIFRNESLESIELHHFL